jgi:hypothetical protein
MKRKQTVCLLLALAFTFCLLAGCTGEGGVSPDPSGASATPPGSSAAPEASSVPPVAVSLTPEQDLNVPVFVFPGMVNGAAAVPHEESPIDVSYGVSDYSGLLTSTMVGQQALADSFADGWNEKMRETVAAVASFPPDTSTEKVIDMPAYGGKGLQVDLDFHGAEDMEMFWRVLLLYNDGKLVSVNVYGLESEREAVMAAYDDFVKNVKLA